tara:strand:- start:388 stop:819 length:432 start_codon:yes stop_codon:yes gene_type:complete
MEFEKSTKFQKTVLSVLMDLKFDKNNMKEMREIFLKVDSNNDGVISIDEFKAAQKKVKCFSLGKLKWDTILRRIDLDGDGKLDYHEFYTACVNHQKLISKENIKFAFEVFDKNGDGEISVAELQQILPTLYRNTIIESSSQLG